MTRFCCISLTLAAKLIGTFGLSLSILMINMLVSNFFSSEEEEEFIIALESWMLFGLNWTYVMKSLKVVETARTLLTCVLIYSVLSLVANALLALGSLLKKPSYVLPWMYMQMVSIIDQMIALTMQLTQDDKSETQDVKSIWHIPVCSIYLLISSYFWMVVSSARREWLWNGYQENFTISEHPTPQETIIDSNVPKTPSFLSNNVNMVFPDYSGPPPPPPKYDIV